VADSGLSSSVSGCHPVVSMWIVFIIQTALAGEFNEKGNTAAGKGAIPMLFFF
jgi:hypothetical protein